MEPLRFTLLSDGPSDRALLPVLRWLVGLHAPQAPFIAAHADLRHLRNPPRGLKHRVEAALQLYPCDILFIHRDAENQGWEARRAEIEAVSAETVPERTRSVPVIPVRMQEAWLLIDEAAIRWAAGNPNGTEPLGLPRFSRLEDVPDPKAVLHDALCAASGLRTRRLSRFKAREMRRAAVRVADLIDDFSPLRTLTAFEALEDAVAAACADL